MIPEFLYKGEQTPIGCKGLNPQTLQVGSMLQLTVSLLRLPDNKSVQGSAQTQQIARDLYEMGSYLIGSC